MLRTGRSRTQLGRQLIKPAEHGLHLLIVEPATCHQTRSGEWPDPHRGLGSRRLQLSADNPAAYQRRIAHDITNRRALRD